MLDLIQSPGSIAVAGTILTALLTFFGRVLYVRHQKSEKREDRLDTANDSLLTRLEVEVTRLKTRCDELEKDRERYFREAVNLSAQVQVLSEKMKKIEEERENYRLECDRLRGQYQKAHDGERDALHHVKTLEIEVATLKERVATLSAVATLAPRTQT